MSTSRLRGPRVTFAPSDSDDDSIEVVDFFAPNPTQTLGTKDRLLRKAENTLKDGYDKDHFTQGSKHLDSLLCAVLSLSFASRVFSPPKGNFPPKTKTENKSCQSVLRDPVDAGCPSIHYLCQKCIILCAKNAGNGGFKCPTCRQPPQNGFKWDSLKRVNTFVKKTYLRIGCKMS